MSEYPKEGFEQELEKILPPKDHGPYNNNQQRAWTTEGARWARDYFLASSMELLDKTSKLRAENAELREALEEIKWTAMEKIDCPDGIEGCAVSHRRKTPIYYIAEQALAKTEAGE